MIAFVALQSPLRQDKARGGKFIAPRLPPGALTFQRLEPVTSRLVRID
jgi:hypothetical protein